MNIGIFFTTFRKLSSDKLFQLLGLLLTHPVYSVFTAYATLKTYAITEQKFPEKYHGDGKGNAFRHALWTSLIMAYCSKISSPQKVAVWCKKISDTHEDLFVNEPLQRAMDLHNNQFGMDYFFRLLPGIHRQFFEAAFFSEPLFENALQAKKITAISDLDQNRLAYMEESDSSTKVSLG